MSELAAPGTGWVDLADATSGSTFAAFWSFREVSMDDGQQWRYEEPGARTSFEDGAVTIEVPAFERSHDVQRFDNPKHLLLSNRSFVLDDAPLWIGMDISATKHGGRSEDFRDGFASLNVVDHDTGLIFDIVSTGTQVAAIWERHPRPGERSFTNVVDAPLHTPPVAPGEWLQTAVCIDPRRRVVEYYAGSSLFFVSPELPVVPKSVRIGIGLFTLKPVEAAKSTSLRGQGMTGRWRRVRYAVEDGGPVT